MAIDETVAEAAVDRFGNAVGGVPSPFLNVPIARYEVHSTPGPLCKLAGREVLLPVQVLSERYGDVDTYLAEFTASLDATVQAGFLWAGDRAELLHAQTLKARDAFAVPRPVRPHRHDGRERGSAGQPRVGALPAVAHRGARATDGDILFAQ